jgi:hypothetical protein
MWRDAIAWPRASNVMPAHHSNHPYCERAEEACIRTRVQRIAQCDVRIGMDNLAL